MAPRPNIVTRAQWGAATRVAGNRGVAWSQRRRFVVHWPVMTQRDAHQWARDIERIHVSAITRDAAPAYNALVHNPSGVIMEGCGLAVRGPANGTNAANIDGISCCVLQASNASGGNRAALSQATRNSTRALYEWCSAQAGRRLTMSWHGQIVATACPGPDLIAWVRGGMQAQAVTPSPPPPQASEDWQMIASGLAGNGSLHTFVVGPARQTVWFTWQRRGETAWNEGRAGQRIAGLIRLADARQGRTITGIAAATSAGGHLTVFVRYDDGSVGYTWQPPGGGSWNLWHGRFHDFAPRP